jgi:hypothetical protein
VEKIEAKIRDINGQLANVAREEAEARDREAEEKKKAA